MPKKECTELIALGVKLTTLGCKLDGVKEKIRRTYLRSGMKENVRLQKLVDEYNSVNAMWIIYEARYLELKEKIEMKKVDEVKLHV